MNETFLSGWGSASKIGMALVAATAITGGSMVAAETAQAAGFTGFYAPGSWTTSGNVSFNVADPANTNATLTGVGATTPSVMTITPETGITSFAFNFIRSTFNASTAFYIANGTETLITSSTGAGTDLGVITVPITISSAPIGFRYTSASGSLAISQFTTTSTTPIPSPAMLPGLIGAGLAFWRRKDNEDASEEV